jgi:hypothetical protein
MIRRFSFLNLRQLLTIVQQTLITKNLNLKRSSPIHRKRRKVFTRNQKRFSMLLRRDFLPPIKGSGPTHATVWQWFQFREMLAEAVLTRYRHSASSISNRERRSLYVNIADASLLMMR